jgi:hypothetical protein
LHAPLYLWQAPGDPRGTPGESPLHASFPLAHLRVSCLDKPVGGGTRTPRWVLAVFGGGSGEGPFTALLWRSFVADVSRPELFWPGYTGLRMSNRKCRAAAGGGRRNVGPCPIYPRHGLHPRVFDSATRDALSTHFRTGKVSVMRRARRNRVRGAAKRVRGVCGSAHSASVIDWAVRGLLGAQGGASYI